jgi:GNAT superfamily N-acetyltransferase
VHNIVIRPVRPSDQLALGNFYAALSTESRRQRFLGSGAGIGGSVARTLCSADHEHEEGFVALAGGQAGRPATVVGHVCLVVCGEQALELAIAVADGYQGQGIGRRLFEEAVAWASHHDVACLSAVALADNSRVLRLLTSTPCFSTTTPADAGVVEVAIEIAVHAAAA